MKKTSLSDLPFNEIINDFGTERYVNGLIKFIENSSAPITIALQGEWGSGKTSLMTRLERSLCSAPESQFIGIDINTWEYSMMSSPETTVYNILSQLVKQLTKDDPDSKKTFMDFLRGVGKSKLGKGLYRAARDGIKMIPGAGPVVEGIGLPTELPDFPEHTETASLSELKNALANAVNNTIEAENKRGAIIFVDDLDRLNPPVAVEILELLKNIFTLDNCIFVLAIDYDVVVKGLKPKFGELTENNEREFRSFFDKIIQVPFSLPVNNYRPMDFVFNSLVSIGYIEDIYTSDPKVRDLFTTIVEASVGKNPRSIKRLINTLSLLDCIAKCGDIAGESGTDTLDNKSLNLIIVSIQICYPKIYRMLSRNPEFTGWDADFARKMGIRLESVSENDETSNQWENILEAACEPDAYLKQHLNDITLLLNLMIDILAKTNHSDPGKFGKKMKEIMDKSSVTGINAEFKAEDFNKKNLISKLHSNVMSRINALRPDINKWQFKRNTGNGGLYFWIDDDMSFDVTFTPSVTPDKKISLRLWLDFYVALPERLNGKTFDELMQEQAIADNLCRLDSVLAPLLTKNRFFKGCKYEGNDDYFPSYIDELRYLHNNGSMSDSITNNPQYWLVLDKPSYFESNEVVNTIADILIANYDFRKAMKNFK